MYRLTGGLFGLMTGVETDGFGWPSTSCLPLHETLGFLQNVCVSYFFWEGVVFFFYETPTGAKFVI